MKLIRLGQQLKCILCQKSQQGVKKLIASPDHHTYICDDCTVERGRLRLGSDNALTVSFRCSFCRKRQCFLGFYVSRLREKFGRRFAASAWMSAAKSSRMKPKSIQSN